MKWFFCILIFCLFERASAQKTDSVFIFYPTVIRKVEAIKKLDSVSFGERKIVFNRGGPKSDYLEVFVLSLKDNLLEEGGYKLDTARNVYNIITNLDGSQRKEVRYVECRYLREGYWRILKRNKQVEIYYHRGKKLKMKV